MLLGKRYAGGSGISLILIKQSVPDLDADQGDLPGSAVSLFKEDQP
jgi:hypothetical protein